MKTTIILTTLGYLAAACPMASVAKRAETHNNSITATANSHIIAINNITGTPTADCYVLSSGEFDWNSTACLDVLEQGLEEIVAALSLTQSLQNTFTGPVMMATKSNDGSGRAVYVVTDPEDGRLKGSVAGVSGSEVSGKAAECEGPLVTPFEDRVVYQYKTGSKREMMYGFKMGVNNRATPTKSLAAGAELPTNTTISGSIDMAPYRSFEKCWTPSDLTKPAIFLAKAHQQSPGEVCQPVLVITISADGEIWTAFGS